MNVCKPANIYATYAIILTTIFFIVAIALMPSKDALIFTSSQLVSILLSFVFLVGVCTLSETVAWVLVVMYIMLSLLGIILA